MASRKARYLASQRSVRAANPRDLQPGDFKEFKQTVRRWLNTSMNIVLTAKREIETMRRDLNRAHNEDKVDEVAMGVEDMINEMIVNANNKVKREL